MSSHSLPSYLEASHSFPHNLCPCESSNSSPTLAHPSTSSLPSLYVTFKVFQLVSAFRQRVKTRVQSGRFAKKASSTRVAQHFCQDFERQAFEDIDRYLGRKTGPHSQRKRSYPKRYRRSTSDLDLSLSELANERVATDTELKANEEPPRKKIQWLLDELNQSVKSDAHSLTIVAADNRVFVNRKTDFHIERLSLKELTQLLVVTQDLLNTLRRKPSSRFRAKTLAEGNELLDLSLNETHTANLEHLLLCLRDQLIRSLVTKLVDIVHRHVIECQRDQTKHCEEWFFEYPDARHPLCTTWPWNIRPSLAVLWGVCWMFYNFHIDEQGNIIDDQLIFDLMSQQPQVTQPPPPPPPPPQHQPIYYPFPDLGPAMNPERSHVPPGDPRLPGATQHLHSPNFSGVMTQPPHHSHRGLPVATTLPFFSSAPDQPAHASPGLAVAGTNNTYTTAAPPHYATTSAPPNWSLPQENFAPLSGFNPDSTYGADEGVAQWQHLPHSVPEHPSASSFTSYPATSLPPRVHRAPNQAPPDIRLTTDFSTFPHYQQQPQDIYHSATPLSSASSHPLQEAPFNPFDNAHLSPQNSRFPQMTSDEKVQPTPPRSPVSPQVAGMGEQQLSRKRSHEEMIAGGPQVHPNGGNHSRHGSDASHAQDHSAGEEVSPRARTIKRGEPPLNHENKYYCNMSPECQGLTFDRKCEWGKHMDKHDRPYHCDHPSCAKLQGFTYSGGLLRHEREVHGKHGGPKAQLMCPYEECKRHAGKGFTRKENLNEHIRRVHQSKDSQSQGMSLRRETMDVIPGSEDVETPASRYSENIEQDEANSPMQKRRRYNPVMDDAGGTTEQFEALKAELHRLENDNKHKENQIVEMQFKLHRFQEAEDRRQEEMSQMQDAMRQLQQSQQQGQV